MPSGVSTPWLMALLRNSTLPGSIRMLASGSRCTETSQLTAPPISPLSHSTMGAMPKKAPIESSMPTMPAEKLFTSISKPARILPSQMRSTCLITHAPSGPMIMAPMNIGMLLPTITPMVAMLPTTPPRTP